MQGVGFRVDLPLLVVHSPPHECDEPIGRQHLAPLVSLGSLGLTILGLGIGVRQSAFGAPHTTSSV